MSQHRPCDLAGLSVLVTRPAEQAVALAEAIAAARGRPVSFPALEILGPADKKAVRAALQQLDTIDLLIFVSANAVRYAFPQMPDHIPFDLQIAAVGSATAKALEDVGLEPTLVPEQMDSEGLLALPQLQNVNDKRILIVRGNGGRETLHQILCERGAQVDYVEAYRRQLPQRHPANLIANWASMVEAVTVTSVQLLENLLTLLGEAGTEQLRQTPLVVISQRIAERAAEHGCGIIYISDTPREDAIVRTLCEVLNNEYT